MAKYVICEAAKVCIRKFTIGDDFSCQYSLPHKKSHAPHKYCAYMRAKTPRPHKMWESSFAMQLIEYIHGKTILPTTIKELETNRKAELKKAKRRK